MGISGPCFFPTGLLRTVNTPVSSGTRQRQCSCSKLCRLSSDLLMKLCSERAAQGLASPHVTGPQHSKYRNRVNIQKLLRPSDVAPTSKAGFCILPKHPSRWLETKRRNWGGGGGGRPRKRAHQKLVRLPGHALQIITQNVIS